MRLFRVLSFYLPAKFDQNVSVARLSFLAKAGEVFPLNFVQIEPFVNHLLNQPIPIPLNRNLVRYTRPVRKWADQCPDFVWVSPLCRTAYIDRVWRHLPAACAFSLYAFHLLCVPAIGAKAHMSIKKIIAIVISVQRKH